jgi:hypothetical protein
MLGLNYLVMGAAHGCLGQTAMAISNFRQCLASRSELPKAPVEGDEGIGDHHIAAFASYELAVLLCTNAEVGELLITSFFCAFYLCLTVADATGRHQSAIGDSK